MNVGWPQRAIILYVTSFNPFTHRVSGGRGAPGVSAGNVGRDVKPRGIALGYEVLWNLLGAILRDNKLIAVQQNKL